MKKDKVNIVIAVENKMIAKIFPTFLILLWSFSANVYASIVLDRLYVSDQRNSQFEIQSTLADTDNFYVIVRKNTYGNKDYQYDLITRDGHINMPADILKGVSTIGLGSMRLNANNDLIIPTTQSNKLIVFLYSKRDKEIKEKINITLPFTAKMAFLEKDRLFIVAVNKGTYSLKEIIFKEKSEFEVVDIKTKDILINNIKDIYLNDFLYVAGQFKTSSSKEYQPGIVRLSIGDSTVLPRFEPIEIEGPRMNMKILGLSNEDVYLAISAAKRSAANKNLLIYHTDFESTKVTEAFNEGYYESDFEFNCNKQDVISLNIESVKFNNKLSYMSLRKKQHIFIDEVNKYEKIYGKINAFNNGNDVYAVVVYDQIVSNTAHQNFSIFRFQDPGKCN